MSITGIRRQASQPRPGAKAAADAAEIFQQQGRRGRVLCAHVNEHPRRLPEAISSRRAKAVYCEKPIGLDYQEAVKRVGVVRAPTFLVMLGSTAGNSTQTTRRSVTKSRRGEVGNPRDHPDDFARAEPSAISYLATSGDNCVTRRLHFSTSLRWITGDEAERSVRVRCRPWWIPSRRGRDVDTSIVTIRWPSGRFCQIDSAWRAA
mgnify:CR=1 FL=1